MVQSQSGLSAGGSISLDSVVNQKDPQLQRSPAFLWVALKTLAATLEVKDPDRNSVGLLKNPAQVRRRSRDTRHDEKDACSYDRSRAAWDSPKAGSIVFLYTAIDTESTGTDEAGLEKSTVPSEDRNASGPGRPLPHLGRLQRPVRAQSWVPHKSGVLQLDLFI
jgi:hypothetical protein